MSPKRRYRNTEIDYLLRCGEAAARDLNKRRKLRALAGLVEDLRNYGSVYEQSWKLSKKRKSRELYALDDRIEKQWKRYKEQPFHLPAPHKAAGVQVLTELLNKKIPLIEAQTFYTVRRLLEHGEFDRLRRCERPECRKWLFAGRRRDKRFCSTLCRQIVFENTPARKKRKRDNSRNAYIPKSPSGRRRPYRRKHAAKAR